MDAPKHREEQSQNNNKKPCKIAQRAKALWKYFTTYEKIWYISILVLALVFAFIFPEEDTPTQMLQFESSAFANVEGTYDELNFESTVGSFVIEDRKSVV